MNSGGLNKKSLFVAVILLLVYGFSYAQGEKSEDTLLLTDSSEEIFQLDTIVVTGTASDNKTQEIESRKLKSHKEVDLAEILSNELVEVQMIRKSGYGNEVSMRGFGQENMKVLLDGGMLEGACGSRKDPSLSHINMLTVQKLVIQQGPFDVTKPGYLGGYIDVITKKPKPGFEGEILTKIGSYGFHSGGMTTSGGNDKVQGLIGYNFSESDQYEDGSGNRLWTVREGQAASYNDEGRDEKAFQKHDVWGKLQFTPSENHTILLEHTYGNAQNILTPRVSFDTEEEISNLTKASWEMRDLGDLSEKLSLSFFRNEVDHSPSQEFRNVAVPKNNDVESVITGGTIQNRTETGFATLTYGIDLTHRDWWGDVYNSLTGTKINDNLIPSVETINLGAYLQVDKTFEKWSLGLGGRYDRFQQEADEELLFSGTITDENRQVDDLLGGHISAKYFLNEHGMVFGGVGRNYRTPTSTERYIQGSATYFGNPELKPTANTEFDLGFAYERGRWMFRTKVFYSDLEDYIYQEETVAGYRSYTNIDAHIWGGDIKAGVDLMYGFSLEGGLAYQRGRKDSFPDNNDDKDLGQIAPFKGKLALHYNSDKPFGKENTGLFGTVEWVHSEAARDIDADVGEQRLAAWDIMNLRMGYQFKSYTLNIGVDNVFDRDYTVANSYEWDVVGGTGANPAIVSEPGRFLYATIGMNW
ncbi:TonB-dependent receptor [Desulfosarcina ovata]|uniref:Membrane protein n=2 Tax=Desulfosarcina ovata TaxID=83564 RepID=A0A5K8AL87_9BACT|nr:TonB-dependent receptor [Desulfosarcina ovata]BBO86615.1 membrane protein [Desulfosarcina ovata subsp. sediminis]BBO93471.1 membrane protein [Desulfosarcina ovata subsp. ovata]